MLRAFWISPYVICLHSRANSISFHKYLLYYTLSPPCVITLNILTIHFLTRKWLALFLAFPLSLAQFYYSVYSSDKIVSFIFAFSLINLSFISICFFSCSRLINLSSQHAIMLSIFASNSLYLNKHFSDSMM